MSSTKFPHLTIVSIFAVALGSCNGNNAADEGQMGQQALEQTAPSMPTTGGGMMQQLHASCPMVVDGADVAVSDTDDGVALTFTTEGGNVADLRTRVQHMARMYELHAKHGGMMWHHMGRRGMGHGMGMGPMAGRGPMPAASATVTEIDNGARLELRPADASQLDTLREHTRWHQQRMESGDCWMLQGQTDPPERGAE